MARVALGELHPPFSLGTLTTSDIGVVLAQHGGTRYKAINTVLARYTHFPSFKQLVDKCNEYVLEVTSKLKMKLCDPKVTSASPFMKSHAPSPR